VLVGVTIHVLLVKTVKKGNMTVSRNRVRQN
jgi:hypothetical protein